MPLSAAVYVSSVDKIFGVYGPKVLRFNATTGQLEISGTVVTGPAETTCGIAYHSATGSLYVSTWNTMANQQENVAHPQVDIFPVDVNTLAVGAGLGWTTLYDDGGDQRWPSGPRALMDFGQSDLYFVGALGSTTNEMWLGRIDPSSPAFVNPAGLNATNFWLEQCSSDNSSFCYSCNPNVPEVLRNDMALTPGNDDSITILELGVVMPFSIEHVPSTNRQYAVGGNQWMVRVDSWGPDAYTVLNLDLVNAGSEPMRLRYRASDSKLYIPCQTTDGIILWEPGNDGAANTSWFRSGFNSPIDVVFTNTKAFAVQNGPVSLKEITV